LLTATAPPLPRPGPARSGAPLLYALLLTTTLHGLLLLGLSFTPEPVPEPRRAQSLRVVLVRPQPSPDPPDPRPELAAQRDQAGAGSTEHTRLAAQPEPAPPPAPEFPEPTTTANPAPAPVPAPVPAREPPARAAPPSPQPPALTARRAERTAPARPAPARRPPPAPARRVTAADLLASRSEEIARLSAELDRKSAAYASRPRRRAVSASTREYRYAAYLEAWRQKVERIGNLNYPDEARRKRLFGNLVLHVAVRADGSVERISVLHSSGHRILDDAAVRIVSLAAPFAPFPANIARDVDVLDITRTWQFLSNNRLGAGD
jgi:protein TonB